MSMGGIDPGQRWHRHILMTEVTEIIDAGPMVETVIVPFGGAINETENFSIFEK